MIYEVYKETSEDWYPSYRLSSWSNEIKDSDTKLVCVTFTPLLSPLADHEEYRVHVWGSDDCGMEKDFTCEKKAWSCFLEVIGLKDVTFKELLDRQFVSA
jgi:hypothetical protein